MSRIVKRSERVPRTSPNKALLDTLLSAFRYYNRALFFDTLPEPVITLSSDRRTKGHFINDWYLTPQDSYHEIALNPAYWTDVRQALSTLVHEMCHLQHHITVGLSRHDKDGGHSVGWGVLMKNVGLYPSNTGMPGGKETGVKMTHYIIPGGRFDLATQVLLDNGFIFPFVAEMSSWEGGKPSGIKASRTFTCRECGLRARSVPWANLICGTCQEPMSCHTDQDSQ